MAQTPRPSSAQTLALGLSQATEVNGRAFSALNAIRAEMAQIEAQLPGSQVLLNEAFTRDRLRQELQANDYSIVHMATHGEFGAEP